MALTLAAAAIVRYAAFEPAAIGHLCGAAEAPPWCAPWAMSAAVLHAGVLGFTHPASGEEMRFESELPSYLKDLEKGLSSL